MPQYEPIRAPNCVVACTPTTATAQITAYSATDATDAVCRRSAASPIYSLTDSYVLCGVLIAAPFGLAHTGADAYRAGLLE